MAYLKHLAVPYKAKACTKLWQAQPRPAEEPLGTCTDVRTTRHHWPWKSTHPDPNKTALGGLEMGWGPAPCGLQPPHLGGTKAQCCWVDRWPQEMWRDPRASTHMKTISWSLCQHGSAAARGRRIHSKTNCSLQLRKKTPQLTIRAKCSVFYTNTHLCTEPCRKIRLEQYLASR